MSPLSKDETSCGSSVLHCLCNRIIVVFVLLFNEYVKPELSLVVVIKFMIFYAYMAT